MQRKEGAYLQALTLPCHFWLPLLPSCFCPFISSAFTLASSFSQVEEKKKKNTKKKNHREKKNAEKGRSLPFFSRFYIWDEALLLLSLLHIPSTLSSPPSSSLVSHVSSKLCATQAWELSWAPKVEWTRNEVGEVRGNNFGAEKGAEKSLGRGRGRVFGSSPKRLEQPHSELVHW